MMHFYTKLDADEALKLSQYDRDAPISLWLLGQRHVLGDHPVLLLRRDGKTVALLSDGTLPTSVREAAMGSEVDAEPIVAVWTPPDQVRTSTWAVAEGDLARLEDFLEDLMQSGLYEEQSTMLQLVPESEVPLIMADMWGWVLLEDMDVSQGLAPFVLPPGSPQVESILAWATNGSLDRALEKECVTPQNYEDCYTMYHREMLERFGVRFGGEGGYSVLNVKAFPPLVVPSHLGDLRIDVDHIGGVDCGLLPYGGFYEDMRIGFIHLPLPEGNRAKSSRKADFEECRERALRALFCAQRHPFCLDVTDGKRHHILYCTQNNGVTGHTDCTPAEAYYLLSGLLKGEMTYGGALPDPGHFMCPAYHSASTADNTEAPATADSYKVSGTINADTDRLYAEDGYVQVPVKPGGDTDTNDDSDNEDNECSLDEEEISASVSQAKELEESLDIETAIRRCTGALQSDGEESQSGCLDAEESDAGSDGILSTCTDGDWEVI